jgi:hypothetical protein
MGVAWRDTIMIKWRHVFPVLVIVSGCERQPVQTRIPPATVSDGMSDAAGRGRAAGPGVRYLGPEELDPGIRESTGAVRARNADRMAREAASRPEAWRNVPLTLALTDEPLPAGALAALVRDPAGRGSRLLVFSRESLDDEAFILADLAMRRDEIANPSLPGRRILFVTRDQRVLNERGTEEARTSLRNLPGGPGAFAARLLAARSEGELVVPGVGKVTVLAPVQ